MVQLWTTEIHSLRRPTLGPQSALYWLLGLVYNLFGILHNIQDVGQNCFLNIAAVYFFLLNT